MKRADLQPTIQQRVNLPSKGLLYDESIPESFNMSPMTVNEIKMLYGYSNTGDALDHILSSVIDVEDFPVGDLLMGDKLYLAYQLRALTFGETYTVNEYCPTCKEVKECTFNLLDADIDYIPDDFEDPRSIGKLPMCGDELTLKLLRNKDFKTMLARVKEIREKFPDYDGDPLYAESIAFQIHTVNGKKMLSRDKEQYVLSMHAMDALYIDQKSGDVRIGPKATQKVKCPVCGEEIETSISVSSEDFFRPKLSF